SNHPAPTSIYTLSLHDALPIYFSPFHSSILHFLHVLFSFFFPILLLLLLSTPYLTRNPPSSTSISFYPLGPILTPIPSSALSPRSEEHTSELQSRSDLVCRLLL